MGFDVFGKHPTSERGEYFRRNIWGWGPLIEYVLAVSPKELTEGCTYWFTNDGDGLGGVEAQALGRHLKEVTMKGALSQWHGTGETPPEKQGRSLIEALQGGILGEVPDKILADDDEEYPTEKDVFELADFMIESGGFEIC